MRIKKETEPTICTQKDDFKSLCDLSLQYSVSHGCFQDIR